MMQPVYGEQSLAAAKAAYERVKMPEFRIVQLKEAIRRAKIDSRRQSALRRRLTGLAAAVALFIALPNASAGAARAMSGIPVLGGIVQLVTFRDYTYEDERHSAKIETPQLVLEGNGNSALDASVEEINAEIARITDELTALFKDSLTSEGYSDMLVSSEIVTATEEYFSLRLICYQANASGYEADRYYTVDLATGEWLHLGDLFVDGADYVTPISEEIKRQMREQMETDEDVSYWIDNEDPDWAEFDFSAIDPDAEFYLNENGEVVISFNKGEVAPYYMGVLTFSIPNETIVSIRK